VKALLVLRGDPAPSQVGLADEFGDGSSAEHVAARFDSGTDHQALAQVRLGARQLLGASVSFVSSSTSYGPS
jgi:hypothetical protein